MNKLFERHSHLMRCQYDYFENICEYLKGLGYDPDDLIFQHDIDDAFHKELVASNHERIAWTEMDEANTKMLFRSVNRDEMIRILQSLRNMTNTHDIENVLEAVITEAGEAYALKREPNFPSALSDENLENIRKSRELREKYEEVIFFARKVENMMLNEREYFNRMFRINNNLIDLEQTCDVYPSMWNAKTEDGHTLLIRYINGNLMVEIIVENVDQDDYDCDSILIFQKGVGGDWDGEMTTEEMLEHTGLQWRR